MGESSRARDPSTVLKGAVPDAAVPDALADNDGSGFHGR
jgi:hypothetical protein